MSFFNNKKGIDSALIQDIENTKTQLADMTQNAKAIVVLTQAAYDLLGVEKNTNNTLYLIKG